MEPHIRQLHKNDWSEWKQIRLDGLKANPEAFASTYDEEIALSEKEWKERLHTSTVYGIYMGTQLAGCVGFYVIKKQKIQHKGMLYGLYIRPEYRGLKLADNLLKALINAAREHVKQLLLAVTTTNQIGVRLYQKHGFIIYGTEPKSLKMNDVFYNDYLMILELN